MGDLSASTLQNDLENARQQARAALERLRTECHGLQTQIEGIKRTNNVLEELPKKLRHAAMISHGNLAFFSGHLVNTNECFVKTGEYYFGTTAHEARQILDRRHERLQGRLDTSTTDMASLETSLQVLSGPLASDEHERVEEGKAEGIAEICEEYNEFLHGTPPKREASSGAASGLSGPCKESPNEITGIQSRSAAAQSEPTVEANQSSAGLSDNDAIFKRLEQLEEEEEAAQAGEIGIGRGGEEGTDGASSGDTPRPARSLETATASLPKDRERPAKRVSWQEDNPAATVTATATSKKGPKSKQLVRGFFNKPQKPKSIMKATQSTGGPGMNITPKEGRTLGHQQSIPSEAPAVIADVIERSNGLSEKPKAKPSAENKASEGTSNLSSAASPTSSASEPLTEQPKKMSRFKQQRARLHGQLL